MSYQFIFITGQPDAQNIQQMAAAVAPVGEQAATSATPALRAQLLAPQANPAPVASTATAPSLRPKGSKTTSKTSVKPTIHYQPPAGGTTPVGIRPPTKGPRPEIAPPGNLTPSPGEASTKLEAVDPFSPHGEVSKVPVRPSAFSHLGLTPGPRRPPPSRSSLQEAEAPRPSTASQPRMRPEPFLDEHQRKRPKGSDPSPLPPGIWDEDLGVYDPYHRFSTIHPDALSLFGKKRFCQAADDRLAMFHPF